MDITNNLFFSEYVGSVSTNACIGVIGDQVGAVAYNMQNNTFYGLKTGIALWYQNFPNSRSINNIIQNCKTGITGTSNFSYSTTTITNDATSPQTDLRNKTVAFTDAANFDFSVPSTETLVVDKGVARDADAYYPFSLDILGTTRPQGSAWDIGAFEYSSGGGSTPTVTAAWYRREKYFSGLGRGIGGGLR
jgi:hypothetical protein